MVCWPGTEIVQPDRQEQRVTQEAPDRVQRMGRDQSGPTLAMLTVSQDLRLLQFLRQPIRQLSG